MFNRIGEIIVEVDSAGTDEDKVGSDIGVNVVGETIAIEEDHFFNIEILDIIQSVAIETFDQDLIAIVP